MSGPTRPTVSNADEWQLWLLDHVGLQDEAGSGCAYLAVQIVEAIEEHQKALAREVYGLAEETEAICRETASPQPEGAFARGRIYEAKGIARAINSIMPYSRDPAALAWGGRERLAGRLPFTEQQISLICRMEAYASRFDNAGKPQHAEVIREWIKEIKG